MSYNRLLLFLLLTTTIVSSVFSFIQPKKYPVPDGKSTNIDTDEGYEGDTTRRKNINAQETVLGLKDIKTGEIYKNDTFLLSNVLPIATNPYNTESSKEKYVYTYKLIKEQGMVVGIDQTIEMYDELIYEERLMIGNVQYSQLFFERTIDGEQLLYFAHYLLSEDLPDNRYKDRYFLVVQVISESTKEIVMGNTFEISTFDLYKNIKFTQELIEEMKVLDVLIANNDTIYVNAMFYSDFFSISKNSGPGNYKSVFSQLFSIDSDGIQMIYATDFFYISNLLIDNNNTIYFLEDFSDPREYPYVNANFFSRSSGAKFVVAITDDERLWGITCFLSVEDYHPSEENGCFDLQLDSNGTLYLLTNAYAPSSRNIDLYPDSVSTIYTINTNGTGIGGYAKPALQSIKKENREPLYKKPRARLNDSNVNVRAGYSLQNTVLFQVHEGDMLELRERTKSKYHIGELHDYWYKGYILEKDGVTRKTEDGEEVNGWIYGAFLEEEKDNATEQHNEDTNGSLSGDNNTPSQNTMLLLISSVIALLLVGLGVIVRKKQKKP